MILRKVEVQPNLRNAFSIKADHIFLNSERPVLFENDFKPQEHLCYYCLKGLIIRQASRLIESNGRVLHNNLNEKTATLVNTSFEVWGVMTSSICGMNE